METSNIPAAVKITLTNALQYLIDRPLELQKKKARHVGHIGVPIKKNVDTLKLRWR